jgi:hypothetical protein
VALSDSALWIFLRGRKKALREGIGGGRKWSENKARQKRDIFSTLISSGVPEKKHC